MTLAQLYVAGASECGRQQSTLVGLHTPRWYGGQLPTTNPVLASCIYPKCFRIQLTQCRALWLAYLLLDTVRVSSKTRFQPFGSHFGPVWPILAQFPPGLETSAVDRGCGCVSRPEKKKLPGLDHFSFSFA